MTDAATACCISGNNIAHPRKVIHHCHLTGHIFGVAHPECNLKARSVSFLPVFSQNLSRYDAHHIIKQLSLKANETLSAISRTDEVYISSSVSILVGSYTTKKGKIVKISNAMRFLDSFLVMTQCLHFLAKTLKKEDFALLREHFSSVYPQVHWTLFSEKGFFPYSYHHSFEKFNQPQPAYGDDWKNTLTGKIDVTEDQ